MFINKCCTIRLSELNKNEAICQLSIHQNKLSIQKPLSHTIDKTSGHEIKLAHTLKLMRRINFALIQRLEWIILKRLTQKLTVAAIGDE